MLKYSELITANKIVQEYFDKTDQEAKDLFAKSNKIGFNDEQESYRIIELIHPKLAILIVLHDIMKEISAMIKLHKDSREN